MWGIEFFHNSTSSNKKVAQRSYFFIYIILLQVNPKKPRIKELVEKSGYKWELVVYCTYVYRRIRVHNRREGTGNIAS